MWTSTAVQICRLKNLRKIVVVMSIVGILMRTNGWLVVNKNGIKSVRKSKPFLEYNEIAVKINLEVPNELFDRPTIEATLKVEDIPNESYSPELLINTAQLIEQQTGAKVVINVEETKE